MIGNHLFGIIQIEDVVCVDRFNRGGIVVAGKWD
jgi:hypothetical protein